VKIKKKIKTECFELQIAFLQAGLGKYWRKMCRMVSWLIRHQPSMRCPGGVGAASGSINGSGAGADAEAGAGAGDGFGLALQQIPIKKNSMILSIF